MPLFLLLSEDMMLLTESFSLFSSCLTESDRSKITSSLGSSNKVEQEET